MHIHGWPEASVKLSSSVLTNQYKSNILYQCGWNPLNCASRYFVWLYCSLVANSDRYVHRWIMSLFGWLLYLVNLDIVCKYSDRPVAKRPKVCAAWVSDESRPIRIRPIHNLLISLFTCHHARPSLDTNVHTRHMNILLTCGKKYRWTFLQIAIWEKAGKIASAATVSRALDEDEKDFGASVCMVTSLTLLVILSRWKDAKLLSSGTTFNSTILTEEECRTRM